MSEPDEVAAGLEAEANPSTTESSFGGPPPHDPGPSPGPQGGARRKAPRWTIAFLRALERCGEVRAAAADAGIDFSTAYARRRAHPEFAEAWAAAVAACRARWEEGRGSELAEMVSPPPLPVPLPPKGVRGQLVVAGGQVKRAGPGRWSGERERGFLEALTAEANVKRAAAAAGISTQALYKRRLKDRHFAAAWDAAVETGKARLHALLVAQAERTFDPDELPIAEDSPRFSVPDAIRLLSLNGGARAAAKAQGGRGWQSWDDEPERTDDDYETIRNSFFEKVERLSERDRDEKEEAGWTWCEEHQMMLPPGWVRQE